MISASYNSKFKFIFNKKYQCYKHTPNKAQQKIDLLICIITQFDH